jgi:hypothetical protein
MKKWVVGFSVAAAAGAACAADAPKPIRQASSLVEAPADRQDRPNVILMMADDLGDVKAGSV